MKKKHKEPKKHDLKEIAGSGDTIRIGDVFMMVHVDIKDGRSNTERIGWRDPHAYRLTRVFTEAEDAPGVHLSGRRRQEVSVFGAGVERGSGQAQLAQALRQARPARRGDLVGRSAARAC